MKNLCNITVHFFAGVMSVTLATYMSKSSQMYASLWLLEIEKWVK